jgi:threonine aldolase
MLAALEHASLGDDVSNESTTTTTLEQRVASLFQKPSSLFVLSGTMGNLLSLRAHLLQPPHSVLCDARSHVQLYEAGGIASLSQAMTVPVRPSNGLYLTLPDVVSNVVLSSNIHVSPTRVIALENTIAGVIMPLEDLRAISRFARSRGIKVHLDGVRLWNACDDVASLREYAAEVDSLSVCFSKSLGAPVGSCIVGEEALVRHARHMRKAVGGGVRQAGVLTAMMDVALDEVFLSGRLRAANVYAARLADKWGSLGGVLTLPSDTNMVWLDLEARGVTLEEWAEATRHAGVTVEDDRVVCHYREYKFLFILERMAE